MPGIFFIYFFFFRQNEESCSAREFLACTFTSRYIYIFIFYYYFYLFFIIFILNGRLSSGKNICIIEINIYTFGRSDYNVQKCESNDKIIIRPCIYIYISIIYIYFFYINFIALSYRWKWRTSFCTVDKTVIFFSQPCFRLILTFTAMYVYIYIYIR